MDEKKNYCDDLRFDCQYSNDGECPMGASGVSCELCEFLTYHCSDCLHYADCDLHPVIY